VLRTACLISFGLHASLVAASARWWIEVEHAPIEEEEYFSLQIRPRSGELTGNLEGAAPTVEIVDATAEPVGTVVEPVGADERALDVVSPLFEEVAVLVAPPAEQTETLSDTAATAPDIEAVEAVPTEDAAAEVAAVKGAAAESSAAQGPTVAAALPNSSSIGGSSTGDGAPAATRLGVPTGAPDGPSAANAAGDDFGPLALEAPPPVYPPACVRSGKEGSVLCALHISTAGRVTAVEVLQSSGHRQLDEAAKTTLLRWRFEPARKDGHAIAARIQHRVRFRLE
jgi:protein TonB